jgi:hypothetical protein
MAFPYVYMLQSARCIYNNIEVTVSNEVMPFGLSLRLLGHYI